MRADDITGLVSDTAEVKAVDSILKESEGMAAVKINLKK